MLPERHLLLLTAYVDGELSPRQRRHVDRLLRKNEEARDLLRKLQADSRQLIDLPRVSAPSDLSESVMSGVSQLKRRPVAARPLPVQPHTFPTWTGWVAAAAVLVAVGLATYLNYSGSGNQSGGVVKKDKREDIKQGGGDSELVKNGSTPKTEDDPPEQPEES